MKDGLDLADSTCSSKKTAFRFQFECSGCGTCCRVYIPLISVYDCARLKRITGQAVTDFTAGYSENELGTVSPDLFFNSEAGRFAIGLKRDNGGCVFLHENLCSIHQDKPAVCRLFPVQPSWSENGSFQTSLIRHPIVNAAYDRGFTDFGDVRAIYSQYADEFECHRSWIRELNTGGIRFQNARHFLEWLDNAINDGWGSDIMGIP